MNTGYSGYTNQRLSDRSMAQNRNSSTTSRNSTSFQNRDYAKDSFKEQLKFNPLERRRHEMSNTSIDPTVESILTSTPSNNNRNRDSMLMRDGGNIHSISGFEEGHSNSSNDDIDAMLRRPPLMLYNSVVEPSGWEVFNLDSKIRLQLLINLTLPMSYLTMAAWWEMRLPMMPLPEEYKELVKEYKLNSLGFIQGARFFNPVAGRPFTIDRLLVIEGTKPMLVLNFKVSQDLGILVNFLNGCLGKATKEPPLNAIAPLDPAYSTILVEIEEQEIENRKLESKANPMGQQQILSQDQQPTLSEEQQQQETLMQQRAMIQQLMPPSQQQHQQQQQQQESIEQMLAQAKQQAVINAQQALANHQQATAARPPFPFFPPGQNAVRPPFLWSLNFPPPSVVQYPVGGGKTKNYVQRSNLRTVDVVPNVNLAAKSGDHMNSSNSSSGNNNSNKNNINSNNKNNNNNNINVKQNNKPGKNNKKKPHLNLKRCCYCQQHGHDVHMCPRRTTKMRNAGIPKSMVNN